MEKLVEQIHKNIATFGVYNKSRLKFLRDQLPQNKKNIFDLIPVLLHEEEIMLPNQDYYAILPSGISNFSYNASLSSLVKSYFPNFSPERKAKNVLSFNFLAVMGSAGTLAFNGLSDIDFWIGMDTSKTDPYMLECLKKKLEVIEKWAHDTSKLEIHLFITDIKKLNDNDFGNLEGESCGTALAKLLKDEFYRTAIFVAGKLPFYWICPSGINETEYNSILNTLSKTEDFPLDNYENIGHVWNISRSEYFGACLWHILKGLNSPFKSVLKIALLDKYTSQNEESPPLCDIYKKMVLQSEQSSFPDPYVFMVNSAVNYFADNGYDKHKRVVEQSFLINNLINLDPYQKDYAKKIEIFSIIASKWGWSSDQIKDASLFKLWDTNRQNAIRDTVLNFFADTYKRIRKKTIQFDISISQKDMSVIGKKFMAFFIVKKNKIPFEIPLLNCVYYLGYLLGKKTASQNATEYTIYAVIEGEKSNVLRQISTSHSPIIPIVSLIQNAHYNNKVPIKVFEDAPFSSNDVADLLKALQSFFKFDKHNPLTPDETLEDTQIMSMLVIPNWNIDSSVETIVEIDIIYQNNIGEMFHEVYTENDSSTTTEAMLKKFTPAKMRGIKWSVFVNKAIMTHKSKLGYKLKKHLTDITS